MKILVADDSKTTLALISASLKKLGHDVIPTSGGAEAILKYQEEHPDLIILDVVMENMDGFECAKRIRELDSQNEDWIPIIFLSSSVDDINIERGINAGGDDYLTKPFSEITLAAKIKAMQRIAEMRKRLCETTQDLQILSSTDTLTGIANRLHFEIYLKDKIHECDTQNKQLALLFIDLDHFKNVNDRLGHHIGDLLLQEVTKRISSCLAAKDFIARIGGDEFVVILTDIKDSNEVNTKAKKIVAAIDPIYNLKNHIIHISASIGISTYPHLAEKTAEEDTLEIDETPETPANYQTVIQDADFAMYHAKEVGRNNFQYFTEDLNQKYRQQFNLEHELRFAIERNELVLTYQPICNLLTRQLIGMEALLRWRHPQYGLLSPNIFIPIAEETGQIAQIGAWVISHVCEQGALWYESGFRNFKLSINVSLHQFHHNNFIKELSDIVNNSKWPTKLLQLELTESIVITYTTQLKSALKKIQNMGIGIAIDDFGTRYSSLTSLKYLPINTLKIHKTFLTDITTDTKNTIIVKALIALANSLNLDIIAEGIQNEEQLHFLVVNGCFQGQGFFLSRPLSAQAMTEYLNLHAIKTSVIRG